MDINTVVVDINSSANISKYLINLLDEYMGKYYDYYENNLDDSKNECIEITKKIHDLLAYDCNFIKIVSELPKFMDKHIDKTKNYDFVILAYGYLFKKEFFNYFLNFDLNVSSSKIKNHLHISLAQILIIFIETIKTYIENENNENIALDILLYEPISILKKIYNNLDTYKDLDYIKNSFIEMLCEYDLEEIYTINNNSIGCFENDSDIDDEFIQNGRQIPVKLSLN